MSRDGELIRAEQEARDEAERMGWNEEYLPDLDERGPAHPPNPDAFSVAAETAIRRERERRRVTHARSLPRKST